MARSARSRVEPRIVDDRAFAWISKGGPDLRHAGDAGCPRDGGALQDGVWFPWAGSGLGDLELVELNEGSVSYFGTDTGLLVVAAPKSDAFDLRDGDVIQTIDGREPKDVRHAMRILASYQAGEKLELGIMRDRKKVTIDVEIPADHHGKLHEKYEIEVKPAPSP